MWTEGALCVELYFSTNPSINILILYESQIKFPGKEIFVYYYTSRLTQLYDLIY